MTLLNLVKKIATDVEGIKTDVTDLKVRVTKIEDTLIRNNIR